MSARRLRRVIAIASASAIVAGSASGLSCGPNLARTPASPRQVTSATPHVDPPLDPDDAAVYARVLRERLQAVDRPHARLLIARDTRLDAGCFDVERSSRLHGAMPTLRASTLGAFLDANATSIALSTLPPSPAATSFLDAETTAQALDPSRAPQAWRAIEARIPDAAQLVVLSRIGFDDARRDALVYYLHASPARPTIGYALHLVKSGEGSTARWTIFDEATCGAS